MTDRCLGKIIGIAVRCNIPLDLNFPTLFWSECNTRAVLIAKLTKTGNALSSAQQLVRIWRRSFELLVFSGLFSGC
jgi:hypothetical protein